MFDNIDEKLMEKGLVEALKYQINRVEEAVGTLVAGAELAGPPDVQTRLMQYRALSEVAKSMGIETHDYDLTFYRIHQRLIQLQQSARRTA